MKEINKNEYNRLREMEVIDSECWNIDKRFNVHPFVNKMIRKNEPMYHMFETCFIK